MSTPRTDSNCLFQGNPQVQERIHGLVANVHLRSGAPCCALDGKLAKLLGSLQESIVTHIDRMSEAPLALSSYAPSFSWIGECVRLQTFYCSLRHVPGAGSALKVCISIREAAEREVSAVRASQNLSFIDIELQQRAILSKAWDRIGKLIFCADRVPQELEVVISTSELEDILLFAEKKVACDLQKAWGILHMNSKVADSHALQAEGAVFRTEMPKEIARLLLTSQGQLNLGVIGLIKERFFPATKMLSKSEQGIAFVLDRMNSSWQVEFDKIQVPKSPKIASNAMIRADLGLLAEEKITQLHCQQEVLGAILSQLNKKRVGDCFTAAWELKRHHEFLLEQIKDFAALIHCGYLTRIVDGKEAQFFFENALADDSIAAMVTLERKGPVVQFKGAPFWKCPNLISACRLMGVSDFEKRKDDLLNEAFTFKCEEKSVTWDDLIQSCAESVAGSSDNADALLALGRYGFSLSNNRLLKAWEAALAGTLDPHSGCSVRESINDTVMNIFDGIFTKKMAKASTYQKALVDEMKINFRNAIDCSFRLVYNEAILLPYSFSDGSFTFGGYQLFQRDFKDLTNKGIRIATPAQFQTFVLAVIDTFSAPTKGAIVISSVIDALQTCVLKDDFMKKVICSYDSENADEENPVGKYEDMDQTPMTSLCKDYCPENLNIDAVNHFNPDIKVLFSKNPSDLLKWMLHVIKWKNSTERYLKDRDFDEAFFPDLLTEGAEFQSFHLSKMEPEEWVSQMVLDPGLSISRAKIDFDSKLLYQQKVKAWLLERFASRTPRSLEEVDIFFTKLNSKTMTVQQFAQRAYVGLSSIFHHDVELVREISLVLDSFLLESLPKKKLYSIQQDSVRFAKLNEEGTLFCCCFFNPRTESIDLGSITLDKAELKPIGQQEWEEVWK